MNGIQSMTKKIISKDDLFSKIALANKEWFDNLLLDKKENQSRSHRKTQSRSCKS